MGFKIALDLGPLKTGSAFRGIGVMVNEQINSLNRYASKDSTLSVDVFDFKSLKGIQKLESGKYDLVHYTSFFPYLPTLPPRKYGKCEVVTIQDLIHLVYPDKYPPGIKGRINFLRQKKKVMKMDGIITISETSKKDIVRFLEVPPDKVHVVYLAPSSIYRSVRSKTKLDRVRRKYRLPERFVFNLGDVNYNKNILTMIKACEEARIPLVLGGKQAREIDDLGLLSLMNLSGPRDWLRFLFDMPHPENAHYEMLLDKFKDNKKILRLGYIPDEDIAAVFSLASVYVQPSYYEGFGLSVVHAFACDVPVVISKTNCLVEVAGGAALIADPDDVHEMSERIKQAMGDRTKRDLIKLGKERLKFFSWNKNARQTAQIYHSLIGS
jgi:glycosyltransferase involved in cell wall biosynthesis